MESARNRLGQTLGLGVATIAVFNTVSSLSKPVHEPHATVGQALLWLALLLTHAAIYFSGARIRARFGVSRYVGVQAAVLFSIGLSGMFQPAVAALYFGLTIETVLLAGEQWGSAPISIGATLLFAINAVIAWDLYQGATMGLLLALTGFIAHAAAGLLRRRESGTPAQPAPAPALSTTNGNHTLTARELEVLRAVAGGARSSQIASDLRIAERTVKAHLASIYQKLGVDSRAAAVAAALQRGLVS